MDIARGNRQCCLHDARIYCHDFVESVRTLRGNRSFPCTTVNRLCEMCTPYIYIINICYYLNPIIKGLVIKNKNIFSWEFQKKYFLTLFISPHSLHGYLCLANDLTSNLKIKFDLKKNFGESCKNLFLIHFYFNNFLIFIKGKYFLN